MTSCFSFAQESKNIEVFFLYGSKPSHGFKNQEKPYFGGKHGGHVSIGFDTAVVGFGPHNGFHIFAHRKNFKGAYKFEGIQAFRKDTVSFKYSTFEVPVTDSQYVKLQKILNNYLFVKTPYDYAFIGMRCASAAYDVLSQVGLFKSKSKWRNIFSNFYPKPFRRKMFKLAKKNNLKITTQNGRASRKWEND
jgi:hypothetical protein